MKSYQDVMVAATDNRILQHVFSVSRHEGWGRYEVLLYATLALNEANKRLRQALLDAKDRQQPLYLVCADCPNLTKERLT